MLLCLVQLWNNATNNQNGISFECGINVSKETSNRNLIGGRSVYVNCLKTIERESSHFFCQLMVIDGRECFIELKLCITANK